MRRLLGIASVLVLLGSQGAGAPFERGYNGAHNATDDLLDALAGNYLPASALGVTCGTYLGYAKRDYVEKHGSTISESVLYERAKRLRTERAPNEALLPCGTENCVGNVPVEVRIRMLAPVS